MMTFNHTANGSTATNSIRPVQISLSSTGESFLLEMEEGTLYERLDVRRHFNTFEEAVRYAETNVGVSVNWGQLDKALENV